jgi:hypothetical protein
LKLQSKAAAQPVQPWETNLPQTHAQLEGFASTKDTMFAATRRWFQRNRTPIAIGLGVVGAGYIVTTYVLGKLRDARERMSSDRIAKEKCVVSSLSPTTTTRRNQV